LSYNQQLVKEVDLRNISNKMEIQSVMLFLVFLWAEIHLISSFTDPQDGNVL
jgi:hypothetical protein